MAVLTSESVLEDLCRLPLLSPEQKARVQSAARRTLPAPERIVDRLVGRGWLTPFQAEALLTGRGKGLLFGDYVLLSKLGEGGMGTVFKARHIRLGRIDALKVIRPDRVSSKVIARRFLREIQLTADLNHPHIVKALDAGQVGKQFYLATEYIEGEDLTTTVRRGGVLTPADACLVIYQTTLALKHIHERGLIHRDLKPSNIMREEKARAVKVLDLGLCHCLNEFTLTGSNAGTLTRDGVMLGTPDFMPPEQSRNPHGVDIRADLYSLGCTFFYLLTGRLPYEGSPVEKLMQHNTAPIPPLVLPHGPTPAALAAIVERMMAKDPEERFQSPQELIDALLSLRPVSSVPGEPGVPLPVGAGLVAVDEWQSEFDLLISQDPSASGASPIPPEPKPRRNRSHPWWWVAAAVGLVVVSVSGFLIARSRPTAERTTPDAAPVEEEPADEMKSLRKAVLAPGGNREQLRSRVLEFRARNAAKAPAAAAASLLRKLPSPLDRLVPEKVNGTETSAVRLAEAGHSVLGLAFSPTDEQLLVFRTGKPPESWSLPSGKLADGFAGLVLREDAAATVSADARTVLAIDPEGELVVWSEGRNRRVDLEGGAKAACATILPDGRSAVVAFADSSERVVRISLETGKIVDRVDHPSEGVQSMTVSPDGAAALVWGPENMIRVLSLTNGKLIQAFDSSMDSPTGGGFGPDGQSLYLVGAYRTAARFAPGSLNPTATYEVPAEKPNPFLPRAGTKGRPTCIAVSADEMMVAVGTRSGLHLYSAATGKVTQEIPFTTAVRAVAFSTHGRVLAVALDDGSVLLVLLKP